MATGPRSHLQRDGDELLMMLSTSPDGLDMIHRRHSPAAEWLSTDTDDLSYSASKMKSTSAELATFSNNPFAIPISALTLPNSDHICAISNLSRSKPSLADNDNTSASLDSATAVDSPHAETASPTPSTQAFDLSPPQTRTFSSVLNRQPVNIASGSRRRAAPLKSIDSTFSYDSYATGITSPALSYNEDGRVASPLTPQDNHIHSHTSDKGKGKATQIDDLVDSGPFASPPEGTTTLSISLPSHERQLLLSSSPDGLGHYSPDVADLLPHFELERKAFDWDEFERSLSMSPGAGPSSVTPFTPVDTSTTTALGLSLSSALPATVFPIHSPTFERRETGSLLFSNEPTATGISPHLDGVDDTAHITSSITAPRPKKAAVSMYEGHEPNRRSVTYKTSTPNHEWGHTSRSRANSNAPSVLSRTAHSAGPSPRIKKRSLTLPSWLSKSRESKSPSSPSTVGNVTPIEGPDLTSEGGKDKSIFHKSRRLYKEKGRAHTTPVPFPYIVSPEAIIASVVAPTSEEETAVDAVADAKPVEEVSLFEKLLHRELKVWVFTMLVVLHQEEFERRVAFKLWSVAHANHERWVGREAGMRELIKLTRVSRSWQDIVLDGQLWQSFDLKAFPGLPISLMLKIAQHAGSFVQALNLQGHHHLKESSLQAISASISRPGLPLDIFEATTQLTTINLIGCTSITTRSLHDLLRRSPQLKHLHLRGLHCVTNTTLTEMLGPHCHHLVTLDIRRCSNVSGAELMMFAEQNISRTHGCDTPSPLKVLKIAHMRGTTPEVVRKIGQAFPLLEILDAAYCRDLVDECFQAFVEWPTPMPENLAGPDIPEDWRRFNSGVELSSREAGFDPGDPTKYWRRVTALQHLNISGCRRITDLTCTTLAFTVPNLEFLELAAIGGNVHDDGLIRLFKTTPKIRRIDLEDCLEITDAVIDCLIPEPRTSTASSGRAGLKQVDNGSPPQPGEMLEHLIIAYAVLITPEAMSRLVRGCKKLRVFEADNTRLTGSVMRDFVSRRRHREKGVAMQEGDGSEIVGVDCRAVSENSVKDLKALTRPRRGWRGWEARDLGYEDGLSVGVVDLTTGLIGRPLLGQDECDEKRVVLKSFHSWVAVDAVAEQRLKMKHARENGGLKNVDLPRWLTQWSLGRRSPAQSTIGTPEEREDRGCIVQ